MFNAFTAIQRGDATSILDAVRRRHESSRNLDITELIGKDATDADAEDADRDADRDAKKGQGTKVSQGILES
jgi:hypothetical protein